jgi:hypothetical protein
MYCPNGDVALWSTFMPETTDASGITRFSNTGLTPAAAVAAAIMIEKTIEDICFIREPNSILRVMTAQVPDYYIHS